MQNHINRNDFLLDSLDKSNVKGVEIGAYHNPIAPKASGWQTTIIDYADAEVLRQNFANLVASSGRNDISDMINNIEDVDIVWRGQGLVELAQESGLAGQMDYFISSHNIEHVIDIVDYLNGASSFLTSGGFVAMAIPDLRFTFDFLRWPSTFSDALLSCGCPAKTHKPAHWLDHALNSVANDSVGCWTTTTPINILTFDRDPQQVLKQYLDMNGEPAAEYFDCHRWVFVPASFELLVFDLHWSGMCDLKIDHIVGAEQGVLGSEFLVRLSRNVGDYLTSAEIMAKRMDLQLQIKRQMNTALLSPSFRPSPSL